MLNWQKRISKRLEEKWLSRIDFIEPERIVFSVTAPTGRSMELLQIYDLSESEAQRLQSCFGGTVRKLKPESWFIAHGSEQRPLRVRDSILILNSPEALASCQREFPKRIGICIPPGMAFGTGEHATTLTCLRFLADIAKTLQKSGKTWSHLDVGTGSGILAIASKKLGAQRVLALDNDPDSIRIAAENAADNGVSGIRFDEADILAWNAAGQKFDLITANLFSDLLIAALPGLAKAMSDRCDLVISGILREHGQECLQAANSLGLKLQAVRRIGRWVTAWLTRNG